MRVWRFITLARGGGRPLGDIGGHRREGRRQRGVALLAVEQVADPARQRRPRAGRPFDGVGELGRMRSEEHTSELQSLMRISYAVFCLKKNNTKKHHTCVTTSTNQRMLPK